MYIKHFNINSLNCCKKLFFKRIALHYSELHTNFPHIKLCNKNIPQLSMDSVVPKKLKINGESIIEIIRREYGNYHGGCMSLTKDDKSGIATLCINSPERRNAISGVMMTQLADIITQLEQWKEGKAVILYGADGFFCSGGDLNMVRHIDNSEGGRQMALFMHDNLWRLQSLSLLTIALIQGKALGGGAELTTACDFRLMTANAEIGFVHIRLGVTAGWGGGSRLVQILGPVKALDLMMSGKRLTADEAFSIGLANHVLNCKENDTNDVIEAAKEWAFQYTKHAAHTIAAIKGIVNAAKCLPLKDALMKEIDFFASVWGGPEHHDALNENIKHK